MDESAKPFRGLVRRLRGIVARPEVQAGKDALGGAHSTQPAPSRPAPRRELPLAALDTRVWRPEPRRPAGYPQALPFLPGTKAQTAVAVGGRDLAIAQWWLRADPDAALTFIVSASLAEGWRETASEPPAGKGSHFERRTFARGNERRTVALVRLPERTGLLLVQLRRQPR